MKLIFPLFLALTLAATTQSTQNNTGFKLLNSNGTSATLRFTTPAITPAADGNYTRLTGADLQYTYDEGLPELPQFTTLYQIDPFKNYQVDYTVLASHTLENILIYPTQPHQDSERGPTLSKDESFYQASAPFPENNLIVSDPLVFRGEALIAINLVPCRYFPDEKRLEVFDRVELSVYETGSRSNPDFIQMPRSLTFEPLYENSVINYSASDRTEDFQTPAILYICGGNSENNPYTQSLFDWRRERGYIVYTASTSETGGSASQIKNYIQNAYQTFDPPPEFVGLIGDTGGSYSIPTYHESWSGYGGEGDLPYSQLSGNDILPDVILGRISINNSTDLANVINKTIKYEKAVYMGGNWFEKAALVGDPSNSGISVVISNEYIDNIITNFGMEDVRHNYSGSYSSWMQSQLNEGILYFNYRGYYGVSGFGSGNISNANNGYKTPFATFLTCGTGSFDGTSLSESFIRAGTVSNPKGSVAAVGTATLGTHTLINNIIDMGIYDGIFSDDLHTAGAALVAGKLALFNTYPSDPDHKVSIFSHWNNLMGDPALELWTDTPALFSPDYPQSIGAGSNYFDVVAADDSGLPVADALVTVTTDDETIFENIFTDDSGLATLPVDPAYTGHLNLCITKRNYKPFLTDISVAESGPQINLANENFGLDDSNGNGDGIVNNGEQITLTIPVFNFGTEDASGVTGTLTTSSGHVLVDEAVHDFGTLPVGQTAEGSFVFTVGPDVVQAEDLGLRLELSDDSGHAWSSLIPLTVSAPLLIVTDYGYTGNTMLYPGATEELYITLENQGSVTATAVTAALSSASNLLDISPTLLTWDTLLPGASIQSANAIDITADGDIINGTLITLTADIQSFEGYNRTENPQIQVGTTLVTDPLGPDAHGYYIYDSGDSAYDLSHPYAWQEIDPDLGGSGGSLNMTDNGNGHPTNQHSVTISLPFQFTFYGVDYTTISVSTNGWIAFGESDLESFRNYPIPGAGGPSPMVAAFWDDLTTENGGQVYKYINASEGTVIIEWSQMSTYDQGSLETFQIILYDSFTPSGDDEILIQYKDFNNTSVGDIQNGGIHHGSHSTIGIENHLGNDGLQYTYDNHYPAAAMVLQDESTLFITTRMPEILPMPVLDYSADDLNFTLEQDAASGATIEVSNAGEDGSLLYYNVSKSAFPVPSGVTDAFGHSWSDTDLDTEMPVEWIDIDGIGTQLTFEHNDHAADPIDIGFAFPFYGTDYTQCIVSANGWIGFGEDNTDWHNYGLPSPDSPHPAICPFYDDLNPVNDGDTHDMAGNVYYHTDGERLVVWFDHVAHWNGEISGNYNFQAVLYASGEIQFNYAELTGTLNRCTVGIQNAAADDGLQLAFDSEYLHENLSVKFRETPSWLSLSTSNGDLNGAIEQGNSEFIYVDVSSAGLSLGDYAAYVTLNTNAQPKVVWPVTLSVVENSPNLPGDVNGDQTLNILDVVAVVGFVVGETDPTDEQFWAADLNQDGEINVVDIVLLVNMILNN
ncbi:MAG: hypothetical protein GXO91_08340 [FCB group bacterium]|nr:hypothetical protein [FCB group bacterium]